MADTFLLDTNAYALFFQRPSTPAYTNLITEINFTFYISELTSLEIYSVIGKYRRGIQDQKQQCGKEIIQANGTNSICANTWISRGRNKLNRRIYHDLLKLLSDIEIKKGDIKAVKIPLSNEALEKGKDLLIKHADKYRLGSHDALILGSLIDYAHNTGEKIILVTSDKGLKAVASEERVSFFDPK